jgi:AcrR family transcriptional regulator
VSASPPPRQRLTARERREVIEAAATEVFAERGYSASMDEIARRAGITVPVLYDHFQSKLELHRRLLERHFADLQAVWRENLARDAPQQRRFSLAMHAWFEYVEAHPYAWRMLFQDTTGDPEVRAVHREVVDRSRDEVATLLAREPGFQAVGGLGPQAVEVAWELFRATLHGLAVWWYEHQEVPREVVVNAAMNVVWIGFERLSKGETWKDPD